MPRQRLRFHNGCYLDFHLTVTAGLEAQEYGFHYAKGDDRLVWRLDKHLGHPDVIETHLHLPDGTATSCPEMDAADVIRRIQEDQAGSANV